MLTCDAISESRIDLHFQRSRAERPAIVASAPTRKMMAVSGLELLWEPHQGAFPAATIAELQRWGSYLFELKNRRVEALWKNLCAVYQGHVPLPLALPGAEPDSVQLAWDTDRHHLDITIPLEGPQEWFFMDRETGELRDGSCPDETTAFVELLQVVAR